MSCCGQKRIALIEGRQPRTAASRMTPDSAAAGHGNTSATMQWPGDIRLRYLGVGQFTTRSLRTGRSYACTGAGAPLLVDPQDVESLLHTRLFAKSV